MVRKTSSQSPAQIQRLTILIVSGIGLVVFLFMAGIAGWFLWHKSNLAETHDAVTAKVEEVATLCSIEKKVSKSWRSEGVTHCAEARAIVAERNGAFTSWRAIEGEYAVLLYTAGGAEQRKQLAKGMLGDRPIEAGGEIAMYVDRTNPTEIERPYEDGDIGSFWTTTGIGALIAAAVGLLGWGLGVFNRRRHEAALAAGGSIDERGLVSFPAKAPGGKPLPLVTPLWATIVGYAGVAVLVLGLGIATLAALGSENEPGGLQGAILITAFSLAIWRLCKYFATLGRKPAQATGISRG